MSGTFSINENHESAKWIWFPFRRLGRSIDFSYQPTASLSRSSAPVPQFLSVRRARKDLKAIDWSFEIQSTTRLQTELPLFARRQIGGMIQSVGAKSDGWKHSESSSGRLAGGPETLSHGF
jgi:hypothetical protein